MTTITNKPGLLGDDDQYLATLTPTERAFYEYSETVNLPHIIRDPAPKPVVDATFPVDPKAKYGNLKPPVQLVPAALVLSAAKALGEGKMKYGAFKWRETKTEAMTYVGAILRHLYAWVDGEEIDPESLVGKHHLDGIAGSLAILLDLKESGTLVDNRPPKGPAPRLVLTPKESK